MQYGALGDGGDAVDWEKQKAANFDFEVKIWIL